MHKNPRSDNLRENVLGSDGFHVALRLYIRLCGTSTRRVVNCGRSFYRQTDYYVSEKQKVMMTKILAKTS